jgi:hypothetical protein
MEISQYHNCLKKIVRIAQARYPRVHTDAGTRDELTFLLKPH